MECMIVIISLASKDSGRDHTRVDKRQGLPGWVCEQISLLAQWPSMFATLGPMKTKKYVHTSFNVGRAYELRVKRVNNASLREKSPHAFAKLTDRITVEVAHLNNIESNGRTILVSSLHVSL